MYKTKDGIITSLFLMDSKASCLRTSDGWLMYSTRGLSVILFRYSTVYRRSYGLSGRGSFTITICTHTPRDSQRHAVVQTERIP